MMDWICVACVEMRQNGATYTSQRAVTFVLIATLKTEMPFQSCWGPSSSEDGRQLRRMLEGDLSCQRYSPVTIRRTGNQAVVVAGQIHVGKIERRGVGGI